VNVAATAAVLWKNPDDDDDCEDVLSAGREGVLFPVIVGGTVTNEVEVVVAGGEVVNVVVVEGGITGVELVDVELGVVVVVDDDELVVVVEEEEVV